MSLVLRGKRINVRSFKKSDAESLQENINEKLISQFTRAPYPYNLQDAEDFIDLSNLELKNKKSLVASVTGINPNSSFHLISACEDGIVNKIRDTATSNTWINGGFMCMKPSVFNYLNPGEELVIEAFDRLIEKNMLHVNKHPGYWYAMDTYKDYLELTKAFKIGIVE